MPQNTTNVNCLRHIKNNSGPFVELEPGGGGGGTKPIFSPFRCFPSFRIIKTLVACIVSRYNCDVVI